jgi:DNA-binding transcriptional MerR regulator
MAFPLSLGLSFVPLLQESQKNLFGGMMTPLPDVQLGSQEPLYNIGVVSRMTGISMATLRAWERRYDFPQSERTSGGHRLYSEKAVLRLQWVKARIDEGMQTAQAINALKHQEETGRVVSQPETIFTEEAIAGAQPFLSTFREHLTEHLSQGDLTKADQVLGEALALATPEALILEVIAPALESIGEAWENRDISVATEHLATNYLRQRLLIWMVSGPPPQPVAPIVLACAPDEWHEGSLLIIGALLRRRRWPVVYLGQAVPLPDLATFVRDIKPSLIVTVAMIEQTARGLADWPRWLPEVSNSGRPIFGFGGRIFTEEPEWRERVSGIFLGETFQEGMDKIERLLR